MPFHVNVMQTISLLDWRQVIHVGAIDCAEERNLATCMHYNVEGYPTIKVHHQDNILYDFLSCYLYIGELVKSILLC